MTFTPRPCVICGRPYTPTRKGRRMHKGACTAANARAAAAEHRSAVKAAAEEAHQLWLLMVPRCEICGEPLPEKPKRGRRRHHGECWAEHERRRKRFTYHRDRDARLAAEDMAAALADLEGTQEEANQDGYTDPRTESEQARQIQERV